MNFTNLSNEEFSLFASSHPLLTFHQTLEWASLKETNGWKKHLVGIKKKEQVIAAALLLEKTTPIKKSIFYAPRGFLLDFNNKEILTFFTEEVKKYIKKRHGFLLKIDPYLSYQERDIDGNIVTNGINNKEAFTNLVDLKYKHLGFNLGQEMLQPRWIFTLNVKGKELSEIENSYDKNTKRILKKNKRCGITSRDLKEEELPLFKKIMVSTSSRREFIDRPLSYYQAMWKAFAPNHLKIRIAELNTNLYLENIKVEEDIINKQIEEKEETLKTQKDINMTKYKEKMDELVGKIAKLKKEKETVLNLVKEHGEVIPLGGMLFLIYGKEVVFLLGGSIKEFLSYQSSYSIHEAMINYTKTNGYDIYNFYGITGYFTKENPLFGIYFAKRGFGGCVKELLGEFDLVINKPLYYLYNVSFSVYHSAKHLLAHIKK
ncbi:MAG: peptidoglycan bridge formation glycyltransferase FemA/FemB family protein [Bacilli bacterium]